MNSIVERSWQAHSLDCEVQWVNGRHRCGYVRIPEGHPWHGKDYDDKVPEFRDSRDDDTEDHGIVWAFASAIGAGGAEDSDAYLRERFLTIVGQVAIHGGVTYCRGREDDTWWVGFDCAHSEDTPAEWTEDRVAQEVERLAEQVAAAQKVAA